MPTTEPEHRLISNSFYEPLLRQRPEIEARYREITPVSRSMFDEAAQVLPGGSTRDSAMRAPYPAFVTHGVGSKIYDVDGRTITDLWFNSTSLPLGNAHPRVVEAINKRAALGSAFFAPSEEATALARAIVDRLPAGELVRFTNSGSEAVMMAIRIARTATGRNVVAKFEGSYHGSYDDVSWSVGPAADDVGEAARPNAVPDTGGVLPGMGRTLILPFNDLAAAAVLVEENASEIAALIVEPIANRMGLILPEQDFINGLKALCDAHDILLIFDEVIAYRVGYSGAQGMLGVEPDLTTLGKVIGGGLPVGAVVGRAEVMSVTERGRKGGAVHTGTFNGNPLTMAAGLATLEELDRDSFAKMNAMGDYVRTSLRAAVADLPVQVDGEGSLFKISASDTKIVDYRSSLKANGAWEDTMSLALLTRGFWLTPRLHGCVSTVTTSEEIDDFVDTFKDIIRV